MKPIRLLLLSLLAVLTCVPALADTQPLPPDLARALVQAKSVYIVGGHVQFYKFKHFVKAELVDTTPYDEPCHNEFEKWGRFKIVSNVADADLVVKMYMQNDNDIAYFTVMEVIQPASKKILWSASKNDARSWSTKTAVSGLIKQFRKFLEQEETSVQNTSPVAPAPANPGNQ